MNRIILISVFTFFTVNVMAQKKIVQTAGRDQLGEFRKFWGELTQLVAPCGLYNLFLCHDIDCKKSEY